MWNYTDPLPLLFFFSFLPKLVVLFQHSHKRYLDNHGCHFPNSQIAACLVNYIVHEILYQKLNFKLVYRAFFTARDFKWSVQELRVPCLDAFPNELPTTFLWNVNILWSILVLAEDIWLMTYRWTPDENIE